MDCRIVQALLSLLGSRLTELSARDREDLEAHCDQCDACGGQLDSIQREDQRLSDAVRDVPIPADFRQRLLSQLRAERGRWYRTWPRRHARASVAAALILVAAGGRAAYWLHRPLPSLNLNNLVYDMDMQGMSPAAVENYFVERRHPMAAPPQFRYEFLVSCALQQLEGKLVPHLLFARGDQLAEIYVITNDDFDLAGTFNQNRANSGNVTVELLRHPTLPDVFYLIKYTGPSLDWLQAEQRQGPA